MFGTYNYEGIVVLRRAMGKTASKAKVTIRHGLDTVESKRRTKDDWIQTMDNMVSHGADVGDAGISVLIDYLAKNSPALVPSVPAK